MDGSNAMITDDLDRELADALAVQPSPQFRARVRDRVARERMQTGWVRPLPWAACAAAAVVVALGAWQFGVWPVAGTRAGRDVAPAVAGDTPASVPAARATRTPAAQVPSPVREARAAQVPVVPSRAASASDRVARSASQPQAGIALPASPADARHEVLIAASEQSGVRLLFESVAAGRLQLPEDMLQDLSLPIVEARGDFADLDTPWTDRPEGDVR